MTVAAFIEHKDGIATTFPTASSQICISISRRFYETIDQTITTGTGIPHSRFAETQKHNLVV